MTIRRLSLATVAPGVALALLMTATLLPGSIRSANAAGCAAPPDEGLDSEEMAFLAQINQYRGAYGLVALQPSATLNRSAAWLASDMSARGYFSHYDSAGRSMSYRIWDCGTPLWYIGENIVAGTTMSGGGYAFNVWRNSPGHNTNMLEPDYRYVGIARAYNPSAPYGWYWVTDFSGVW